MRLLPPRHLPEEDLVALLDGELPLPERVALERHLAGCARCLDLRARLERALAMLAAELAETPAPAEAAAPEWRLRPAVGLAGAGVLAGSVGALVLASMLMRRHQRQGTLRPAGAA